MLCGFSVGQGGSNWHPVSAEGDVLCLVCTALSCNISTLPLLCSFFPLPSPHLQPPPINTPSLHTTTPPDPCMVHC